MIEELKNLNIEGDISFNDADLEIHARDISIFKVNPQVIVYPKTTDDIQKVVMLAHERGYIVSVRAGGTCMSGGSLSTEIIINMTRYMNTFKIDADAQTAEVDMGVMHKDLEHETLKHKLLLGSYTSSKDICGIGGMIGNNASGEKSVRHGATIDNVLGLEVILADGSIIRTGSLALKDSDNNLASLLKLKELENKIEPIYESIKDDIKSAIGNVPKVASGFRIERIKKNGKVDLTPLFVGAQGTLGIITKVVLRLVKEPEYTRLLVISVDSLDDLPFILETVMRHNPEGVETFDRNTFERAKNLLEHETVVTQQFFDPLTTLVVLAQFSQNTQEETDSVAQECMNEIIKKSIRVTFVVDKDTHDSVWKVRRSSFTVMKDYNPEGFHAVPCIEDIIVPIKNFNIFVPELRSIIDTYHLSYGFHGHIGDGSLRIVPIFDFRKSDVADTIISFTRDVFALVKSLKGNMSADHSDGIIRTPFIREFYGEKIYEAFVKIKLLLDEKGNLNRGKKVGGTEDMIRKYIIKS